MILTQLVYTTFFFVTDKLAYVRLGWKGLPQTNPLAYFGLVLSDEENSCMIMPPVLHVIKLFLSLTNQLMSD